MTGIIMVSEIVQSNGKTWKENNLSIKHDIPLGTLVEIVYKCEYEENFESTYGLRLFVVNHSRDCDGTPLYDMSFDKNSYNEYAEADKKIQKGQFQDQMDRSLTLYMYHNSSGSIMRNYSRESLKIVKPCE